MAVDLSTEAMKSEIINLIPGLQLGEDIGTGNSDEGGNVTIIFGHKAGKVVSAEEMQGLIEISERYPHEIRLFDGDIPERKSIRAGKLTLSN